MSRFTSFIALLLTVSFIFRPALVKPQENLLNASRENKLVISRSLDRQKINFYLSAFIKIEDYQFVSYLLMNGANPNYCDSLDFTPLMLASMSNNTNITKLLLKKGADINYRNIRGENALQWAVISRKVDQLKLLVENRSEIDIVDLNGVSPLFYALGYSAYDLTSYGNPDYKKIYNADTSYSITKELLGVLVKAGADIDQVNNMDCTPLLFATFQNDSSLVNVLCKVGANPNKTTQDGVTPLMYAAQEGSFGVVKKLIENGADVNYKPLDGNSALFAAVRANKDTITELLLQNKARINEKNYLGVTPLHYAAGYGFPFLTNLLISYKANLNTLDFKENTPLMASVYAGAIETTNILINSGADVNIPDNKGNTPLMIAAQFNDTLLVELLYKAGADINRLNRNNYSALSIAIENNSVETFMELVEFGAKTDTVALGKGYYQQAIEQGRREIATFLKTKNLNTIIKPKVSGVNFYTGFSTSSNDFMVDLGVGIFEPITRTLINVGYKYRPISNRVLIFKNASYYQFWEKRYSLYLSLQHLYMFKGKTLRGNAGFIPGFSNEFSWRYYRGYSGDSNVKWFLVPSIGLYFQRDIFTIIGKWEVAKYGSRFTSANRFNFQLLVTIPTKNRILNKKINWLD